MATHHHKVTICDKCGDKWAVDSFSGVRIPVVDASGNNDAVFPHADLCSLCVQVLFRYLISLDQSNTNAINKKFKRGKHHYNMELFQNE